MAEKKYELPIAGPKSEAFFKEYNDLFPPKPIAMKVTNYVMDRASGSWLYDIDGNKYINMHSQWATNNIGGCHPKAMKAAIEALQRYGLIITSHGLCELHFELARRLKKIMPPNTNRLTWEISGTEAAVGGVSHAIAAKKRPLIISFTRSYSGMSISAVTQSALGAELKSHYEAVRGGIVWAPYPISYRIPGGLTQEEYADWILHDFIEEEILKYVAAPDRIAGVYFEPIEAEGGHWVPPKNFIEGLRKLADKYDWLLIDDEVLVGFGRTGKMWGIDHYRVPVDIVPIAKAISGGIIPLGAIFGRSDNLVGHSGGTFAGQPAACAAGIVTLDVIEKEKLLPKVARNGEKVLKRMKEWVDEYEVVGDSRGLGYLLATEIVKKKTGEPDAEMAGKIYWEMQKNGVIGVWDLYVPVVRYLPPLTLEEELWDKTLEVTEEAIKKAERGQLVGRIA